LLASVPTYRLILQDSDGSETEVEQDFDEKPELGQAVFAKGKAWHVLHERGDFIICWPGGGGQAGEVGTTDEGSGEVIEELQAEAPPEDDTAGEQRDVPRDPGTDYESLDR
jgi:hypothetical protein